MSPHFASHAEVNWLAFSVKTLFACGTIHTINFFYLIPKLFFQRKYAQYAIGLFFAIAGVLAVLWLLSPWKEIVRPGDGQESTIFVLLAVWLLRILGMLFVSTVICYFDHNNKTQQREIDLTHQNIEFEMKFLKTQINPHFLFNALNNIYALSIVKSDRTPDMILKLSNMLRFTLYGSESKKVKLGQEIDYINDYIEFQKLKMDHEPNIKVDTTNCNTEFQIEPMLLIPFVENSFKHGNIDDARKGWMLMEIKTLGPILIFKVRNSMPAVAINKDDVGGIGVENVRKRLDILYPKRYELEVKTTEMEYSVFMKVDTASLIL